MNQLVVEWAKLLSNFKDFRCTFNEQNSTPASVIIANCLSANQLKPIINEASLKNLGGC